MTWQEATDALLQHFKSEWEALRPAVPLHLPNTRPLSPDTETGSWLRLSFVPAYARRIAVGGPLRDTGGQAVVLIFTPLGVGDGLAVGLGSDVEGIWDSAHANGLDGAIHLNAPEPILGIRDPDIPAWRTGVSIPFRIDHTPT